VLSLRGINGASFCRIGLKASVRSRRLTTIGLSRRFLAGSQAAADNHESETHVVLFTAGFFGRGFDSRRLHQIYEDSRQGSQSRSRIVGRGTLHSRLRHEGRTMDAWRFR
jgi:hypothetical protein